MTVSVTARKRVEQLAADLQVARKSAELARAKLDQMFQSAPVFITLLRTPQHVFDLVNPAYRQLMGDRELIGRSVREAVPEVEGQGFFELLDRVYATGERFVGNELPIQLRRKPGAPEEEAFVTFTYEPFRDAAGAIDGIIVFGFDPGIQPDLLPRIFDLFVQGQRTIDRAEGGLGLGLALVKNLVMLHGGSVAVKNRTPSGSEFSVRLPLLDESAPQPKADPSSALVTTRTPRRVLVVDDNEDAAALLSELRQHGPRRQGGARRAAGAGGAALLPRRGGPARHRPAGDGRLRAGSPHSRAGRRTAPAPDRGDRVQAGARSQRTQSAGFDRHLTKPVDLDQLIAAIEWV